MSSNPTPPPGASPDPEELLRSRSYIALLVFGAAIGVPVATVAVGGARNAGLLAVRILAAADPALLTRMQSFQAELAATVRAKDAALRAATD